MINIDSKSLLSHHNHQRNEIEVLENNIMENSFKKKKIMENTDMSQQLEVVVQVVACEYIF